LTGNLKLVLHNILFNSGWFWRSSCCQRRWSLVLGWKHFLGS